MSRVVLPRFAKSLITDQLIDVFGADAVDISVLTLDAERTGVYFSHGVTQIEFSTVFFLDALKACSDHHVAILCEGSTLKSTFANALTFFTARSSAS